MTTKKTTLSIDDAKYAEFKQVIEKICGLLKTKIPNKVDLASVLLKQLSLKEALSKEYKGKPEPFTQQNI
ncbi:hypothetical protein MUP38_06690, partial [Candidatus Bathyarchaeota archaeon]|nr:hypothetical protein [Candidatus Bathyarchaeota archaeon]